MIYQYSINIRSNQMDFLLSKLRYNWMISELIITDMIEPEFIRIYFNSFKKSINIHIKLIKNWIIVSMKDTKSNGVFLFFFLDLYGWCMIWMQYQNRYYWDAIKWIYIFGLTV